MMCIALYNSNYNFECNCNLKYSWAQPDWTPPPDLCFIARFLPHLLDSPLLVRVHHELVLPADGVPHDPGPIRGEHGVT